MDMNLFEKNKALLQSAGDIYNHTIIEAPQFQQIRAEWEEDHLRIQTSSGVCYCDSFYSRQEEFRWLLQQVNPGTEYLVFMGSVSYEAVRYFKYYLKNLTNIIFIEPTNQIFQARLHRENIYEITKSGGKIQVYYFCNKPVDNFVETICNTAGYGNRLSVIASVSYQMLFPQYYQELLQKTIERMRLLVSNVVTYLLSRRKFDRHVILNHAMTTFNAKDFHDFLRGKPAIIVGAGPSLKKNIHLLKEAREKAVIIAGGSSLPVMHQHGIRPHFNVILEAGDNSRFTNYESFADIPLLFCGQTNPTSIEAYKGSKINIVTDTDDISMHYFGDRAGAVRSGPSVINIVHDFVCKMECSPVIFVGQDMCMYDNQIHAIDEKLIYGKDFTVKNAFTATDIYGKEVETITNYWVIKDQLEKINSAYPDIHFINATEGGLGINGVDNELLENVLAVLPDQPNSLTDTIASIIAENMENRMPRIKELTERGFVRDIDKIFNSAKKLLLYAQELKESTNESKQKQLMSRIQYQYGKLQEEPFYQGVVRRTYNEFIKTIEARYRRDLNDNQRDKKIAAFVAQYQAIMKEFMDYCVVLKDAYEDAYEALRERKESVEENELG